MKIIFNKHTGETYRGISKDQKQETLYVHYDDEFKSRLDEVIIDNIPNDLENYYVKDYQLKRYSDEEIHEKQEYGKVLTDEERLLEKIKPFYDEIKKAETTIEILSAMQEVL